MGGVLLELLGFQLYLYGILLISQVFLKEKKSCLGTFVEAPLFMEPMAFGICIRIGEFPCLYIHFYFCLCPAFFFQFVLMICVYCLQL